MNRRIAQNIAELSPDTLFIGIDVGKKRHQVSIMTEKANIVAKFRIDNLEKALSIFSTKPCITRKGCCFTSLYILPSHSTILPSTTSENYNQW